MWLFLRDSLFNARLKFKRIFRCQHFPLIFFIIIWLFHWGNKVFSFTFHHIVKVSAIFSVPQIVSIIYFTTLCCHLNTRCIFSAWYSYLYNSYVIFDLNKPVQEIIFTPPENTPCNITQLYKSLCYNMILASLLQPNWKLCVRKIRLLLFSDYIYICTYTSLYRYICKCFVGRPRRTTMKNVFFSSVYLLLMNKNMQQNWCHYIFFSHMLQQQSLCPIFRCVLRHMLVFCWLDDVDETALALWIF